LLNTAQPADIVNVFRFLARYYDARFSRLAILLNSAVPPALALLFGAIVAAVALAMFLPMIRLIDQVNPGVEVRW
jgi:type II secretory pathway component PulF